MQVTLDTLPSFVSDFVRNFPKGKLGNAYVVGLKGDLGAGKTTFVQAVAKELGVTERVTSPTFVVVKTYAIDTPPFKRLVHADLYRMHSNDTDTIGWSEYVKNGENIILAEWSDRVPGGIPLETPILSFSVVDEDTREIVWMK
ncbi:tRNA (adenosine(37)-N6)-threonylcarbamoyltransferase complex ATPase subunit type 1 TsaE [Patescibacteria group bacterium]|nr:MAG: tRNA (adenosine(37)-N6)-threonylcarbamoyltransferase complex ATPase subunit type 1 TsaE [Patescibacteria group bacterium]